MDKTGTPAAPRYEGHLERVQKELARTMGVTFASSPFRSLEKRFLVACSARSGSHLLCYGLLEHGAVVREHFDPKQISKLSRKWGADDLEEYCKKLLQRFAPNGTFGVKGGIQILAPLMLAGELPAFLADWRFVFLKREDSLKQAISQFIAAKTGSYKATKAPSRTLTDDDFDGEKIARMAGRRQLINAEWEEFFAATGVAPHRVIYEEMVADIPGVIGGVTQFLDLRGPPVDEKMWPPPVRRQTTTLNADWEKRFKDEGWRFGGDAGPDSRGGKAAGTRA